jgi:hypothetical protein
VPIARSSCSGGSPTPSFQFFEKQANALAAVGFHHRISGLEPPGTEGQEPTAVVLLPDPFTPAADAAALLTTVAGIPSTEAGEIGRALRSARDGIEIVRRARGDAHRLAEELMLAALGAGLPLRCAVRQADDGEG